MKQLERIVQVKGFELGEVTFSDQTKYGLIGVIGLGRKISSHLEEFDLISTDRILVYNDYQDLNHKSIKELCIVSDVIFVIVDLNEIFDENSILQLISYLESLKTNTIVVMKNSYVSLNLTAQVKKNVSLVDLDKQENSDMLQTLKNLHRIIFYYNDEYNWQDANYPPSMFWEDFFTTNTEIFLYQRDSLLKFVETMQLNNHLREQLNVSKYCLLSYTNEADRVPYTLLNKLEEEFDDDTNFYRKNERFDDLLLFLGA